MDLVEHYIIEVIEEKEVENASFLEQEWVEVTMIVDVYGCEEQETKTMTREEWEEIKERGYYME